MTAKAATAESAPLSTPAGLVLIALAVALVLVAPIWLVDIVPTQDGPIHLTQADMIARFGWGGVLSEPARTFYEWNARVEPNYSVYAILAALIRLTGDPLLGQSVYLTLYGLFSVVAAYWATRAETDRPLLPFLLLQPIAFGLFIHFGFFNYALGLPAFLAFAALWRGIGERRNLWTFLALALALFALGLTHLATLVAACLLMAAGGLARALASAGAETMRLTVRRLIGDGVWSVAAAVPALALIVAFLIAYPAATTDAANLRYSIFQVVRRLVGLTYLFSYTWWEVVALAPLIAAMAYAAVVALKRWRSGDLVWPIFILLVLLVSALDLRTAQGVPLAERLAPYSWIGAALAIAARQPGLREARILCILASVALAAQSGVRALAYLGWSETTRAVLQAGASHPGQSFAGADLTDLSSANFSWRVQPGAHIHQLAALRSQGVGMGSSLPSMRFYGYYPLRYVPAEDFVFALPEWEAKPGLGSLAAFRAAHKGAPQVLVIIAKDDSGPALARFHGYRDCATAAGPRRSVLACSGSN
ncbi:hypothetical protein [Phreatobacter stygius]|uniref:Glycosyltransferase RgtA/B/C/D-like domain-containing protein n=1 Tax=Phreatobacter stygius TaxID=1940610 RepID=A0A4D7B577_9HYPH|nr:hypothetical protein [Phreatobacter stygius]QCI68141.1 hypothetical protein E8M01_30265 [Phreatobacter stygius]